MTASEKVALSKGTLFVLTSIWLGVAGLIGIIGFGIAGDVAALVLVATVAALNLTALILLFRQPLAAAIVVTAGLVASIIFVFVHFTDGFVTKAEPAAILAAFALVVLFVGALAQHLSRTGAP